MTVMIYPNRLTPKGWRVQDKVLRENRYFPISKHGSLEVAKKKAEQFEATLIKRRYFREMRLNLDVNKIFRPDGTVIGLSVTIKKTKEGTIAILKAQITVEGKQISTNRRLNNKVFQEQFVSITNWILEKKCIMPTSEIKSMLKESMPLYKKSTQLR